MDTAISAIQATSTSSQQSSQPDLVALLAADVNNRQLMAVSLSQCVVENLLHVLSLREFDV